MMISVGWVVLVAIIAAMVGACVGFFAYSLCCMAARFENSGEEDEG